MSLSQLPKILEKGVAYRASSFFEEQLTAFEVSTKGTYKTEQESVKNKWHLHLVNSVALEFSKANKQ